MSVRSGCLLLLLLFVGALSRCDTAAAALSNATIIVSQIDERLVECRASVGNCTAQPMYQPLRFQETSTGSVIADAFRSQLGVPLAVVTAGSINATFTRGQLVSAIDLDVLLPLVQSLVVASVRGEDVLLMLEHAVSRSAVDDTDSDAYTLTNTERFLHVAGIQFVWNPLAPAYARVSHVRVQALGPADATFFPLDMTALYRVGMPDSIAAGADGYGIVFPASGSRAVVETTTTIAVEDAVRVYLEAMAVAGCENGARCHDLQPPTGGRITRNKLLWPPTITGITPMYADVNASSVLTISGTNLGLVPVQYDPWAAGGVRSPIGELVADVTVTVGSNPCLWPSVAQIRVQDGSTRFNVSFRGFNMLASVSALTCTQAGNAGVETAARVWIDTLYQPTYSNYSDAAGMLGGLRVSRLDSPPLFNYSWLANLPCPPDRSYLNSQGSCTCRPGWQVGQLADGAKVCTKCPSGTYSATDDSYICAPCPPGSSSTEGDSRCEPCPENRYNNATGHASCLACPADSSTRLTRGATRCFCNAGFEEVRVVLAPAATVTPTPTPSVPSNTNSSSSNDTSTSTSSTATSTSTTTTTTTTSSSASSTSSNITTTVLACRPCPKGAECRTEQGVARAQPGWWYDAVAGEYHSCPSNFCCDRHDGIGCLPGDPQRCYPHREGFMCGLCAPGYASVSARECIKCPGPNPVVLVSLVVLALIFLLLCLLENPSEDASTKLVVDYLQMCFLILNPTIGVNEILALVNLGFGSATSRFEACVMPMPPLLGISASALIPLGLFVLLLVIHLFHWVLAHYALPRAKRPGWTAFYEENRWRYTNAAWQVFLFGFMAIVSACVQVLDCIPAGRRFVVRLAPSVECFAGDTHFIFAVVALALFCVMTFVVPVWLVGMLAELSKSTQRRSSTFLHSMKRIKALKKEYKRQKKALAAASKAGKDGGGGGEDPDSLDQKIVDLDEYLTRQLQPSKRVRRTGHELVLWCYTQQHYWCEAAFLLRRVIFTLVTVLLSREKAGMIVAWGCVGILVVHARFPVFRKRSSGYFHDLCLGAVAFQSVLNVDIYSQDPTGHVDFSQVSARAQVVVVYGATILPVVVGAALFLKEFLKERVRKRHAEKDGDVDEDEDSLPPPSDSEDEEEEDALPEDGGGGDPNNPSGVTAENSFSGSPGFSPHFSPGFSPGFGPGMHHRSSRIVASHSPGGGGLSLASELASGVVAQGPNVSIRSYTNAPIDLDAVLASAHGGIISSPQFPNNNHPPVTIHF